MDQDGDCKAVCIVLLVVCNAVLPMSREKEWDPLAHNENVCAALRQSVVIHTFIL